MPRPVTIPAVEAQEAAEDIYLWTVDEVARRVHVAIGVGDLQPDGTVRFWRQQRARTVSIEGADWEALHAVDGGGVNPGKPGGCFRKADLWPHVAAIEARPKPVKEK